MNRLPTNNDQHQHQHSPNHRRLDAIANPQDMWRLQRIPAAASVPKEGVSAHRSIADVSRLQTSDDGQSHQAEATVVAKDDAGSSCRIWHGPPAEQLWSLRLHRHAVWDELLPRSRLAARLQKCQGRVGIHGCSAGCYSTWQFQLNEQVQCSLPLHWGWLHTSNGGLGLLPSRMDLRVD